MKKMMTGAYTRNEETFNFNFYTRLTATKKIEFVNSVVDVLISENYNYIIKDLIFDYVIIKIFTDVETDNIEGIDGIEEFLEETNIVDIVKSNVEIGLIEELNKAVSLSIEYRTGIHANPLNEALTSLVNTLEKKINEIDLTSAVEMAKVFGEMTGEITPDNIVNAYLKSDVHKQNLAAIEESKKQNVEIANNLDKSIKDVNNKAKSKKLAKSKN